MSRALAQLLVFVGLLLAGASTALAQTGVEVSARLSSETVEVGEAFILELSAMSGDKTPFSDPLLRLPAGLSASGPSIGSKSLVQMGAAGTMFRRGVSAKWRIVASAAGKYTIPPPSIRAGGKAVAAEGALRVSVVQPGQKPPSRRNVFDPFGIGSPFDDPLDDFLKDAAKKREGDLIVDEPVENLDALGEAGKALALARGDDPYLFLRVVPDKTKVVVGEQVTLRYLEYYRVTNERFDEREPKLPDFLKVPLEDEPGQAQRLTTAVGGKLWFVQELDRVAVFPLRAGELHTGQVTAQFRVPYLKNQTVSRASNDAVIEVREPPMNGRPAGYHVGDVGRFKLSATVTPKQTVAGETVSVSVKVEGRGVMPNQLRVPERTGVEWLTPEKHDESDVQSGRVGGSRTFGYAVRVLEQGDVDLGWVELPHYDVEAGAYRVARAALGTVRVQPKAGASEAPKATEAAEEDPFATLPKPRRTLGAFGPSERRAPSLPWFVGLAAFPSLALVFARLALRGMRALEARRRSRLTEPEHLARTALEEVRAATDPASIAGLAERAIHLAIEASTGLRSRGVLLEALRDELRGHGVPEALAAEAHAALESVGALRYQPHPDATDTSDLARRTNAVVEALLQLEVEEAA